MVNQARQPKGRHDGGRFKEENRHTGADGMPPDPNAGATTERKHIAPDGKPIMRSGPDGIGIMPIDDEAKRRARDDVLQSLDNMGMSQWMRGAKVAVSDYGEAAVIIPEAGIRVSVPNWCRKPDGSVDWNPARNEREMTNDLRMAVAFPTQPPSSTGQERVRNGMRRMLRNSGASVWGQAGTLRPLGKGGGPLPDGNRVASGLAVEGIQVTGPIIHRPGADGGYYEVPVCRDPRLVANIPMGLGNRDMADAVRHELTAPTNVRMALVGSKADRNAYWDMVRRNGCAREAFRQWRQADTEGVVWGRDGRARRVEDVEREKARQQPQPQSQPTRTDGQPQPRPRREAPTQPQPVEGGYGRYGSYQPQPQSRQQYQQGYRQPYRPQPRQQYSPSRGGGVRGMSAEDIQAQESYERRERVRRGIGTAFRATGRALSLSWRVATGFIRGLFDMLG